MYGMSVFQNKEGNFVMYGSILDWAHINVHRWEYDLTSYQWRFMQNELRDGYDVTAIAGLLDNSGAYVRVAENQGVGLVFSGAPGSPKVQRSSSSPPLAVFQNHAPGNFNYEIFLSQSGQPCHTWLVHGTTQWYAGSQLATGRADGVAAFQNNAPGNLNYEVLFTQGGQLRHRWRDWNNGNWYEGAAPGRATGAVAAFQNLTPDSQFNYEVFAVRNGSLRHWWRDWKQGKWYEGQLLGPATDGVDGAVSAFLNTVNHNYEVFALRDGTPYHWWRDAQLGQWFSGNVDIDMSPKP